MGDRQRPGFFGAAPPWLPWDAAPPDVAKGARLYGEAIQDEVAQWQESLAKLGQGRYGPLDAARDAQDSLQRAAGLCADLANLWWQSAPSARQPPRPDPGPPDPKPPKSEPPPAPRADPSPAIQGRPVESARPVQAIAPSVIVPPEPPAASAPQEKDTRDGEPGAAAARPRADSRPSPTKARQSRAKGQPTTLERAERLLRAQLADGERPAQELLQLGAEAGISPTTLRRAKKNIDATARREGFGKESRVLWGLKAT